MPTDKESSEQILKDRFAQLPKVVQDAIMSADVEKQLRTLADTHKLHIDQWSALENEVMLTLLGLQNIRDLAANIETEVGVAKEESVKLATDISQIVFEPIRQELERGLSHPEAQAKQISNEEMARNQAISSEAAAADPAAVATPAQTALATPQVMPATPPAPKPTEKAVRAPLSSAYTARQPSSERKDVAGDPYRELPQ